MIYENDHDYTSDAPGTERLVENPPESEGGKGGESRKKPKSPEIPPLMIVQVLGEDFLYIHGKIWLKLTDEILQELRARVLERLDKHATPQAD